MFLQNIDQNLDIKAIFNVVHFFDISYIEIKEAL